MILVLVQDEGIRTRMRQFPVHRFPTDEMDADSVTDRSTQPVFKGQADHLGPRPLIDLGVERQAIGLRELAFHVIEQCIPAHSASVGSSARPVNVTSFSFQRMDKYFECGPDWVNGHQTASNCIKGELMTSCGGNRGSDAGMTLALLVLGLLLCFLGAGLLTQWQESTARHQDASVDILLAAATAAAGIALLLWWTFSILSASASVVLERLGRRRAAEAAQRLSPAFMRRAVVAALSVQLVTGVAANAATTTPGPEWAPTHAHSSSAPSNPAASDHLPEPTASDGPRGPDLPTPLLPTEARSPGHHAAAPASEAGTQLPAATLSPGWQPASPVVEPGLLAAPDARTTAGPELDGPRSPATAVTVLAGDTLWEIVAAYLGPEASDVDIALEWPRWYAANRTLIGGSPDVLLPGQILQAPAAS